MRMSQWVAGAAVLVGLASCGGSSDERTDGGAKKDGGPGAVVDAGKTANDSGVVLLVDSGTTGPADSGTQGSVDSGTANPGDAGRTTTDAGGSTPVDAGNTLDAGGKVDAGTALDAGTPFDAGSPGDAGTPLFNNCTEAKFEDRTGLPSTTITFPGSNFVYTPACILVGIGHTVTFSGTFSFHPLSPGTPPNNNSAGSANNPIVFTNTGMSTTAAFVFNAAGDYPYYCMFHGSNGMAGVVRVR